jgi:hypothetical protein
LNQVAQLEQGRLENEQTLLQLRRQNLLQGETLPLLHSLCGHTPSLRASSAVGKQRLRRVKTLIVEVLNG